MAEVNKHSYTESIRWLKLQLASQHQIALKPEHHSVTIHDSSGISISTLQLPVLFPSIQMQEGLAEDGSYSPVPIVESLAHYLARIPEEKPDYILMLIRAGQAALGYVEDDELMHHKVIRKYMVRKKQGKAQLTHLRQKGKSRVGSRIRLEQSASFFRDINEKLTEWNVTEEAEWLIYSCNSRLWGHLFRSEVEAPFEPQDDRLRKAGVDINEPNFEELQRVQRLVSQGTLTHHDVF